MVISSSAGTTLFHGRPGHLDYSRKEKYMQKRNFVIRTIRNGEVKIFHKVFVPSAKWMEYDGRLDGLRVAFGLYWSGGKWLDKFIYLWGTEKSFNTTFEGDEEFQEWLTTKEATAPDLVDGYYPWAWWHEKEN